MTTQSNLFLTFAAFASLTVAASLPAGALTQQECGAKYQAAKSAGSLGGKDYNAFRKAECGADAKPVAATKDAPKADAKAETKTDTKADTKAKTEAKADTKAAPKADAKTEAKPPARPATFPTKVSDKYAKETPGKARMHTCVDQYNANKANDANGGLKWIEKGGGYYSQCTAKLKGA